MNVPNTSNDDIEQLDYDEDEEDKKPRDKFSSEKKHENSEVNKGSVDQVIVFFCQLLKSIAHFRKPSTISVMSILNFKTGCQVSNHFVLRNLMTLL